MPKTRIKIWWWWAAKSKDLRGTFYARGSPVKQGRGHIIAEAGAKLRCDQPIIRDLTTGGFLPAVLNAHCDVIAAGPRNAEEQAGRDLAHRLPTLHNRLATSDSTHRS